jgi:hypothetical protein
MDEDAIVTAIRLYNANNLQEKLKLQIDEITTRKEPEIPAMEENEKTMTRAVDAEANKTEVQDTTSNQDDHPQFDGTHVHSHEHVDGTVHNHSHEHSDDSAHDHVHESHNRSAEVNQSDVVNDDADNTPIAVDRTVTEGFTPDSFSVYLPITRINNRDRIVTGQATVEKPDAYGTIFGYYPEAWLKWRGNMREQHDPKKAVGKAIEVIPEPEERAIYVTSKVSRGAQDTWLKIEDGVLTGYSASIMPDPEFGNDIKKWPKKEYEGKLYPYLPRYSVAETSYVDNPATPGCNISLVRADGFVTDIIDVEIDVEADKTEELQRAGARVSNDTQSKMHTSIGHTLKAAVAQMNNCGCDTCNAVSHIIDPDDDGDVDLGGLLDTDNDASKLDATAVNERVLTGMVERMLTPVYARLQNIAGTLAKTNTSNIDQVITSSITRALEALDTKLENLPSQASLDKVQAELATVKDQVVKIAETPMPGGPVMNASVINKSLPTDPPVQQQQTYENYGAVYDAIANLSRSGELNTPDRQVQAMAAGLAAQRNRR